MPFNASFSVRNLWYRKQAHSGNPSLTNSSACWQNVGGPGSYHNVAVLAVVVGSVGRSVVVVVVVVGSVVVVVVGSGGEVGENRTPIFIATF